MDHMISEHVMHHNPLLVFLSYAIAAASAYASIVLARRVMFAKGGAKTAWLLSGAAALGFGIWSMHFIAMLAHHFPVPVYYDRTLVILSVFAAIAGCLIGLYMNAVGRFGAIRFTVSGIVMGLGIAGMHYIGMAALKPVTVDYEPKLFALSIIVAIFASLTALWIGFHSPYAKGIMTRKVKLLASLIMGAAIAGMHYIGMAAAIYSNGTAMSEAMKAGAINQTALAWTVAIVNFTMFSLLFLTVYLERRWRKREIVQTTLLDAAEDGIVVTDQDGRILHANRSFHQLFGLAGKRAVQKKLQDFDAHLGCNAAFREDIRLTAGGRTIEATRHPIKEEELNHSLWILRDTTEKVRAAEKVEFMAFHDALTQLPNRHKLEEILNQWVQEGREVGCIFLDLDRLKFTNDSLGHEAGDLLIKHAADRLRMHTSEEDLIARVGGDEFIIILPGERSKLAQTIADRCVEAMNMPFTLNGVNIRVTVSAGICEYPSEASSANELIRFADLAMYESKKNGKNRVTAFNLSIREKIRRNVQLEELILKAMDLNEFHLVYQPKVCIKSGDIEGVEALLRWDNPIIGNIPPLEFIPIAEDRGMIYELGEWVLEEACTQWVKWATEGLKPVIVAVNISPLQFAKEDFLPALKKIIANTGMDPRYLELEITESASLAFDEYTIVKLDELTKMGIQISLDDFGTGYSSFKHLKELPIKVLKIDKSFLDHLLGNSGQEAIVRSMIQLGHNLELQVLVEGVETQPQLDWLKNEKCDIVQGYLYSRPVSPDIIQEMFAGILPGGMSLAGESR